MNYSDSDSTTELSPSTQLRDEQQDQRLEAQRQQILHQVRERSTINRKRMINKYDKRHSGHIVNFAIEDYGGECVKCGKAGHIGKECRTGWRYGAAAGTTDHDTSTPAVQMIEGKKRKRESTGNHHNKRRQMNQPDGNVRITYINDSDSDSGMFRASRKSHIFSTSPGHW